jgi:hypothetical protein
MRIDSMIRVIAALSAVVLAVLILPEAAAACPVCFDARDENRQAFLATTAFLSLLPLGMVAGTGLWIRRRSRERDELYGDDARYEDRPEV